MLYISTDIFFPARDAVAGHGYPASEERLRRIEVCRRTRCPGAARQRADRAHIVGFFAQQP